MNTPDSAPALTTTHTTHPLVLGAALAVIAASLTGIAHFAGWLPSTQAPAALASTASAVPGTDPAAPVVTPNALTPPASAQPSGVTAPEQPSTKTEAAAHRVHHTTTAARSKTPQAPAKEINASAPNADTPPPPPICLDCGTVESVREIQQEAQGSGLGAVTGGVLGGVLGHQVGNGRGRDVATVLGAIGGAFAGNATEKNLRSARKYQIIVRLEDGSTRVVTEKQAPEWRTGDHVRFINGELSPY